MRKYKLEYLITATLALVVTLLLIWKVPLLSDEHTMKLLHNQSTRPQDYTYYEDLDGDGTSERLIIYYNAAGNLAVSVSDLRTETTINQFNLPGELPELGATLDIHDIDANGIKDMFVCTEKNDSLFMTVIDDLYGHPTTTRLYFLDRIRQFNDDADYNFVPGGISDLTGDGVPEYVFAINGGHSLQPRRVYAVDYQEERVMRSPVSGAAVISLDLFDLDGDGREEVMLNTVSPENFKIPFPYSDSISWLMILDESLKFYVPPLPMAPPPSWLSLEPFAHEGNRFLMAFHRYQAKGGDYLSSLTIYDDQVRPVTTRTFSGTRREPFYLWRYPDGDKLEDIKLFRNNRIYTLDMQLQFSDSLENATPFGYGRECALDLDGDGNREFLFLNGSQLYVFRQELKLSSMIDLGWNERGPRILHSVIRRGEQYPELFIQVGSEQYWIWYGKNGWYRFRAVVYPALFAVLFGLFISIVLIQDRLVSRRYKREQFISRLQLQSIRNQLDPHFTYNALNAMGSLIYKGEKDLAYRYLKGLTDLLRMVSGDAATITWELKDELKFVRKYLEIEELRFKERFRFRIDLEAEALNRFQVPRMSILTFVENAIKHGLRHKEGAWILDITVTPYKGGVKIGIRDNGIGRAAAVKYHHESTGQGIEMMKQYFRQFTEVTGSHARFIVKDLFEEVTKSTGTLVEVTIH